MNVSARYLLHDEFDKRYAVDEQPECQLNTPLSTMIDLLPKEENDFLPPYRHPLSERVHIYGIKNAGCDPRCLNEILLFVSSLDKFEDLFPEPISIAENLENLEDPYNDDAYHQIREIILSPHLLKVIDVIADSLIKNEVIYSLEEEQEVVDTFLQNVADTINDYNSVEIDPDFVPEYRRNYYDIINDYFSIGDKIGPYIKGVYLLDTFTHLYDKYGNAYYNAWCNVIFDAMNDLDEPEASLFQDEIEEIKELLMNPKTDLVRFFESGKTIGCITWSGHARACYRLSIHSDVLIIVDPHMKEHDSDKLVKEIENINKYIMYPIGKRMEFKQRRSIIDQGFDGSCMFISAARALFLAYNERKHRLKRQYPEGDILNDVRNYTHYVNLPIDCKFTLFVSMIVQRIGGGCKNVITYDEYVKKKIEMAEDVIIEYKHDPENPMYREAFEIVEKNKILTTALYLDGEERTMFLSMLPAYSS